ncbi:MAG: DNA ligase [Candidatus Westeberhardia cardiocondylae]|nr:DNA ligase [Candidatus Westeberhardia cardiocondylae]
MEKIKQHILKLKKKLRYWEYLYYYKNESRVSDEKYDNTIIKLKKLEQKYPNLLTNDSPTQKIGKIKSEFNFEKVYHKTPMLSLDNAYTDQDIIKFDKKIKKHIKKNNEITYCCELKIDGIGISLLYNNRILIQASTRGDGIIGENVTKNIYMIHDIPYKLNKLNFIHSEIEIRGEIFMKKTNFNKLNKNVKTNNIFSNPRNATSGSVRQLNPNITKQRSLNFFAYGISMIKSSKNYNTSHWEQLQILKNLGIPINNKFIKKYDKITKVLDFFYKMQKKRKYLNYNIDGIVIKVDSIKLQKKLNFTSKSPRWAIAYKFQTKKEETTIKKVTFQVGKSGIITPIAHINPVIINGTKIKNINLYNMKNIKKLKIMIGDKIIIQKSSDIIPKVVSVILEKRTKHTSKIEIPKKCPSCQYKIQIDNKTSIIKCISGIKCKAQKKEKLKHFVSKNAMNIHGIGKKIINKLVDENIIDIPSDLFKLNQKHLIKVKMFNIKSINNIMQSLKKSKKTTFSKFLYSLNIPNVGKTTSENLSKKYHTINELMKSNIQSLKNIPNIGKISAKNIFNFFQNPNNIELIKKLLNPKIGIHWKQ